MPLPIGAFIFGNSITTFMLADEWEGEHNNAQCQSYSYGDVYVTRHVFKPDATDHDSCKCGCVSFIVPAPQRHEWEERMQTVSGLTEPDDVGIVIL